MFAVTIVDNKEGTQHRVEFDQDAISIGRMKGNDVVLPKGNVSKAHASIAVRQGAFFVQDNNSTNGTYINGTRIGEEQPLEISDRVYIGDFILQVVPIAPSEEANAKPQASTLRSTLEGLLKGAAEQISDPLRQTFTAPPPGPRMLAGRGPGPIGPRDTIGASGEIQAISRSQVPRVKSGTFVSPSNAPRPAVAPPAAPAPPTPPPAPVREEPAPAPAPQEAIAPVDPVTSKPSSGTGPSVRVAVERLRQRRNASAFRDRWDASLFAAQVDVGRVLYEKTSLADYTRAYINEAPQLAKAKAEVERAVARVGADADRAQLVGALARELGALGPITALLEDDEITEIFVAGPQHIFARRDQGATERCATGFSSPESLRAVAERIAGGPLPEGAREVDLDERARATIVSSGASDIALSIRRERAEPSTLDELAERGALSGAMLEFLGTALEARRTVVVAGPGGGGTSATLYALVRALGAGTRTVIVTRARPRLGGTHGAAVLRPAEGASIAGLIEDAVRLRPDRLVLEECRGPEAWSWVRAASAGAEGGMLSLYGFSASDALARLESMCLLSTEPIAPRGVRDQIARSVDLVISLRRVPSGASVIQQIAEVQGVDFDQYRLNDVFYYRDNGSGGEHLPTGYVPLFYEDLRQTGIDVNHDIFSD